MHICGMDFSLLSSYWQIKALLMLEPSVVTPQNQYFPANAESTTLHCLRVQSRIFGLATKGSPKNISFDKLGILSQPA